MKGITTNQLAWWLLVAIAFMLPYSQRPWWPFPASTVVLCVLFWARWRARWLDRVGLRMGFGTAVIAVGSAVALWALFRHAVFPAIAAEQGLVIHPWDALRTAIFPFQALNEEMVLGGLLLFGLTDHFGRPVLWSLLVAVLFAALHYVMYRYGGYGMIIAPLTILGLVAVGVMRHCLIIGSQHIAFAWGLHAAWNTVMFGVVWRYEGNARALREPRVFDTFVGDPRIVVATSVLALVLLGWLWRRRASYQVSP